MQAVCLTDKLLFTPTWPEPVPGPGEVLLKVLLAGVCGTDLELVRGYKRGFRGVLGHEFVGRVVAPAESPLLGRRVVAEINCGQTDDPRHEPERQVLGILGRDGCFADYVAVPERNLHPVPDDVPDVAAVFCEPLAAALRLIERLPQVSGERVAVLGPGRLGLLCALVLRLDDLPVTIIGRRPEALDRAVALGFETDLIGYVPDDTFARVVDATGTDSGLAEALRICRPLGTICLKSTYAARPTLDLSPIVVKELLVAGSRCGPFEPALRLLRDRALDVCQLVEAEYPLAAAVTAFEHAARPGALKILLHP